MPGVFLDMEALAARLDGLKAAGKRIVLCNGIFDLVHVGHVRYLAAAKARGDVLVVAMNDDESARRLKGRHRPYMPAAERAELLCAFGFVDFVTEFPGDTVADVLRRLRPHVHAKGTDYSPASLPERALDEELGIEIAIVGDPKDHSTTDLASRVAGAAKGPCSR
jgi:rfaE bifunctional protein nucleotidyltransferase chain/domain